MGARRNKLEMAALDGEMISLLDAGYSYREVAAELDVSPSVVFRHMGAHPQVVNIWPQPFGVARNRGREYMGTLAEAKAVVWFLAHNMIPSKPLVDCQYDLLVETSDGVKRVQVKSTTTRNSSSDGYLVKLHRKSGDEKVLYTVADVDLFFVVAGVSAEEKLYLIPREAVEGKFHIVLDNLYAPYRVTP